MWLCVIITFSIIGYVWFIDFQNHIVAMVNPESTSETNQLYAQISGPLSGLKDSFRTLGASLSNTFKFLSDQKNEDEAVDIPKSLEQLKPQLLPETK